MNYRVDLILAEEQRSASLLNPKSITRIVCIVVPVAIGLFIAKFAVGVILEGNKLAAIEQRWKETEPKSVRAVQVREACNANLDIVKELTGWRETHINWHEQLAAIQAAVPSNIQFTGLSIQQSLLSDPAPSRSFQILLSARSVGDPNGIQLAEFLKSFDQIEPLKSTVKKGSARVAAGSFLPDPAPQAHKDDRIFRIECSFNERVFK